MYCMQTYFVFLNMYSNTQRHKYLIKFKLVNSTVTYNLNHFGYFKGVNTIKHHTS